jgi:hypothetical protein
MRCRISGGNSPRGAASMSAEQIWGATPLAGRMWHAPNVCTRAGLLTTLLEERYSKLGRISVMVLSAPGRSALSHYGLAISQIHHTLGP